MTPDTVYIHAPATTANLGPGFDCLGLALDLWNKSTFTLTDDAIQVSITGEGEGLLPVNARNMLVRAFLEAYHLLGRPLPTGLLVECENAIPLGSGLGSSAAAVLTGLMAANAFLGQPLTSQDILQIANKLEGHADNASAALYGGLTTNFTVSNGNIMVHKLDCAFERVVVVLPEYRLPTVKARQALPKQVPMKDAVFNISHTIITIEALRSGHHDLLMNAMDDRLHQPYRIGLIPGAEDALQAARNLGAPAALSGAGPSIIAFPKNNAEAVQAAMQSAFANARLESRAWQVKPTYTGIQWEVI